MIYTAKTCKTKKGGGGEGFDPGRYDYINPGTRDNHAIATSIRMAPIMQNPGPTPQWLAVKEGTGVVGEGYMRVECLLSMEPRGERRKVWQARRL